MTVEARRPPARATVCCRMAGSGLETPNVSAPQIAENRELNPNSSSSSLDSHSSLLVQTAKRYPRAVRSSSASSRPSNGREFVGDMRRVMIDKIIGQPVQIPRTDVASVDLQSAFDQLASAGADHVARGLQGHRGQAFAVENEVERIDQVGRRIDQRAVQIEYDRGGRGHGGSLAARGRSCKWGVR